MPMRAAILDIDGTLCDTSYRALRVRPVIRPVLLEALTFHTWAKNQDLAILVVTARRQIGALPTMLWLRRHGVDYDRLYMRSTLDRRSDVEVKADLLNRIYRHGYNPVAAIDDKPEVLDLWRDRGIPLVVHVSEEKTL